MSVSVYNIVLQRALNAVDVGSRGSYKKIQKNEIPLMQYPYSEHLSVPQMVLQLVSRSSGGFAISTSHTVQVREVV